MQLHRFHGAPHLGQLVSSGTPAFMVIALHGDPYTGVELLMEPLTLQDLDTLAELEQKATGGTWVHCSANHQTGGCKCGLVWFQKEITRKDGTQTLAEDTVLSCCFDKMLAKGGVFTAYEETPDGGFTEQQQANNMRFIAALRNAAPQLIAAARQLRELERKVLPVQQVVEP